MSAKIRHVAIAVKDPHKSGLFYEKILGLKRVGETHSSLADGVFLTDGYINIALLKYRTDEAAGPGRDTDFIGTHHFGVQVDDLAETEKTIKEQGGTHVLTSPRDEETLDFEMKFLDPEGVLFDISKRGWTTSES